MFSQEVPVSPPTTLLTRSSQPAPSLSAVQAQALLRAHYGLEGALQTLGSQQDLNYRLDTLQGRFVFKVCHGSYARVELEAQHAALTFLREQGLPVPAVHAARKLGRVS
ncbi:phosphotransferase [Pseudomonas sp. DR48]|nr:phosphotransferase [Pseudomonas sp. DR48]